ncbi:MAG: cation efflux family transporter [Bacteroidetes bacterium GWA2_31_9]|nr:MAG: cation efflux family transporter [Bacteroidetes bacterium GWA2_31_9]
MSHESSSIKSIIYAFLANLGIAIIKTIAAIITGSGSMLAESIHSFADCGNQGLLFLGIRRSKKNPNPDHPMGYGKEIYFWSFIVAIILFSMGGVFSIYEGIHKLNSTELLTNPYMAIIVLAISIVLEGASLMGCLKEVNKIRANQSLFRWLQDSNKSELIVVLGEDIAALLGLTFALIAITLSVITGNPIYDAIGSIGIGVLLTIISFLIGFKVKGLLIGKSLPPDEREIIMNTIINNPKVEKVFNLITVQFGDNTMVAVKAKFKDAKTIDEISEEINTCEKEIKNNLLSVKWIFFEPDNKE